MSMDMVGETTLRRLVAKASGRSTLPELQSAILNLQTADKFRLAGMLLDAGHDTLAAVVGKRATDEIDLARQFARVK